MISGILRNFGQVALDFATLNVGNFPPYLQHGLTESVGLLRKITWPCED